MRIRLAITAALSFVSASAAAGGQGVGPCSAPFVCTSEHAKRLDDAYQSEVTTASERAEMMKIVAKHRSGLTTDWAAAANEYFAWRNGRWNTYSSEQVEADAAKARITPAERAAQRSFECPMNRRAVALNSPSVLDTLLPDYEGQYVTLKGYASGNVIRDRSTGEYTLGSFFDSKMQSKTFDLRMNANLARSWLLYTEGDQANGYFAKALVGIRAGQMHVLKICAFERGGMRLFESEEFSF